MAEGSEHSSGKGVIPYFFYDVISFIIPGASLLIGGFLILFGKDWSEAVFNWFKSQTQHEESIAALSVLAGVAFLLFLGAASAIGFLLSSISYHLVDKLIWGKLLIWPKSKLSFRGLMEFGGSNQSNEKLVRVYQKNFGVKLNEVLEIDRASAVCEYYIWSHSQRLGVMASRFDAEKILCQSLALVSFLLLVESCIWWHSSLTILGFLASLLASSAAFDYHRKKRVYGRFQIFLALCSEEDQTPNEVC